ncbi:hypothetical protein CDAR_98901 [Caerostris darwini]|uniref:Uncharacterized protein n=1 Tax=Caerostris darwini TaxID=1538125 RepID=A0AAV4Q2H3_9ARAC|nr:hypothetical protein CDAR_98901 [Caerostris darwini]
MGHGTSQPNYAASPETSFRSLLDRKSSIVPNNFCDSQSIGDRRDFTKESKLIVPQFNFMHSRESERECRLILFSALSLINSSSALSLSNSSSDSSSVFITINSLIFRENDEYLLHR